MGLYLPPELRWIGWVAGSSWPDGDEDGMWAISEDWKAAAKALTDQESLVLKAKQDTEQAYPAGEGAESMGAHFDQLIEGDHSVKALAETLNAVYESTFDMGTQLQATKITIIASLCWLAMEIAWAWLFPPTAPAAEAASIATTRSFLKVLEDYIQNAIERLAGNLGASTMKNRYFWKELVTGGKLIAPSAKGFGVYAVKAAEGAAMSALMDGAVQVGQIASGKRHGFDWKEFGVSIGASVAGSAPGREVARYLGNGIDKLAGNQLKKMNIPIGSWTYPVGAALRGGAIGIVSGATSSLFGNMVAAAAYGPEAFASPAGWVGGMARGGIVGSARGTFVKSTPLLEGESDVRKPFWMKNDNFSTTNKVTRTAHADTTTPAAGGGETGGGGTRNAGGEPETQVTPAAGNGRGGTFLDDSSSVGSRGSGRSSDGSSVNPGGRGGGSFSDDSTSLNTGGGRAGRTFSDNSSVDTSGRGGRTFPDDSSSVHGGGRGGTFLDDSSSVHGGGRGGTFLDDSSIHSGERGEGTFLDDSSSVHGGGRGGTFLDDSTVHGGGRAGGTFLDDSPSVAGRGRTDGTFLDDHSSGYSRGTDETGSFGNDTRSAHTSEHGSEGGTNDSILSYGFDHPGGDGAPGGVRPIEQPTAGRTGEPPNSFQSSVDGGWTPPARAAGTVEGPQANPSTTVRPGGNEAAQGDSSTTGIRGGVTGQQGPGGARGGSTGIVAGGGRPGQNDRSFLNMDDSSSEGSVRGSVGVQGNPGGPRGGGIEEQFGGGGRPGQNDRSFLNMDDSSDAGSSLRGTVGTQGNPGGVRGGGIEEQFGGGGRPGQNDRSFLNMDNSSDGGSVRGSAGTQGNPGGGRDEPPPERHWPQDLGKATDMKAKTRPKREPEWAPLPGPFEAPTAPTAGDWLGGASGPDGGATGPDTGPGGTGPSSGGTGPDGNPSGTNPAGTNPAGTNPAGTNPGGTNPSGTNPAGTNPAGTNPAGTDPTGTGSGGNKDVRAGISTVDVPFNLGGNG